MRAVASPSACASNNSLNTGINLIGELNRLQVDGVELLQMLQDLAFQR